MHKGYSQGIWFFLTTLCCVFGVGVLHGWFWYHDPSVCSSPPHQDCNKQRWKTHCKRDQLHCKGLKIILKVPKQNTVVLFWPQMCGCHGGNNSWAWLWGGVCASAPSCPASRCLWTLSAPPASSREPIAHPTAGISSAPLSWNKEGGDSHCSGQDTLWCIHGWGKGRISGYSHWKWSLHQSCQSSRRIWAMLSAHAGLLECPGQGQELDLDDPCASLPSQVILWFCLAQGI